jgi:hypothetical protein
MATPESETGASLVARLEALQLEWREIAEAWQARLGSATQARVYAICADALDPILAELRRLQVEEKTEEEAARVDMKCVSDRQDLSQPAMGDTSTKSDVKRLIEVTDRTGRELIGVYDVDSMLPNAVAICRARHNREFVAAHDYDAMKAVHDVRYQALNARLAHEADAVIALVHQQQIMEQQIAELERRVSTLSGLVNR